ncbi:aminotransferase family protein [Actinomadura kijaniata]|uniref:aminotransferase family protein n=1 Tax=Actinomadura kijaniata TaxID=46161 RepID=UPI00082E1F1F|nr:aspartate aminotransferase family protein [Actinomadura kijaniata]
MTIASTARTQSMSAAELEDLDRRHLIHPHQRSAQNERHVMVRGEGCHVWDAHGTRYLDMTGAANWLAQVGHGRPELAEAAARQTSELEYFTSFDVYSNDKSILLAARIADLAPEGLDRVFFTNGGSESVDTAIKAARLFHSRRGEPDRTWIISRRFGYHGVTYGAGSASGFDHLQFGAGPFLPNFEKVTPPLPYHRELYGGEDPTDFLLRELEETLTRIGPERVAAMIGEPVMGGAGVVPPPDDYWPRVRDLLSRHGILLIADEVVTAFGRTGAWFDSARRGMAPDMIVMAKGLTSGYAPLGAVLMRTDIGDGITEDQGFAHGFTYFGHATSCAIALANLDLIEKEGLVDRARQIGGWLREGLASAAELPHVGEIRVAGAMVGIELVVSRDTREPLFAGAGAATAELRDVHQVITRDYGNTIVLAPPLVLDRDDAARATRAITEVLARLDGDGGLRPR